MEKKKVKNAKKVENKAVKKRTFAPFSEDMDIILPEALKLSIDMGQASATMIMRKFGIGYPRAAKIIDQMEEAGYISGANAFTGRTVYISEKEYEKLLKKLNLMFQQNVNQNEHKGTSISDLNKDELLPLALKLSIEMGQTSVTMIRRKLDIGYPRAARIVDQMEEEGYITSADGIKARRVLITMEEFKKLFGEVD